MNYNELLNKFNLTFKEQSSLHKIVIANEISEICEPTNELFNKICNLVDKLSVKYNIDASCFKDCFESIIDDGNTFEDILNMDEKKIIELIEDFI